MTTVMHSMFALPILGFVVLVGLGACAPGDPPSARRERALANRHAETTAPEPEEAARVDPHDVPSPPEPGATQPISNPDQDRLQAVLEAMASAQAEAAQAEGQTTCEQAFESTVRFAASLREALGATNVPANEPDRPAFLRACARLPANVQQCMVMGYSVSHQAECAAVRRDMAPEIQASVRELTKMIGPARPTPEE